MMHPTRSRPPPHAAATRVQAVFLPIQPLDFPDIRLNARVLEFVKGLHHEPGTLVEIISLLVAVQPLQSRRLGRHKQFKHEQSVATVQIVGQPF